MDRNTSTIKRHRQSLRRAMRNRAARSKVKTYIKKVEQATTKESADAALRETLRILDKTANYQVIHPNKTARIKSRLTRLVAGRFS